MSSPRRNGSAMRAWLSTARLESLEWTPGGSFSADGQLDLAADDDFVNDEHCNPNEELNAAAATATVNADTNANVTHFNAPSARNVSSSSLVAGRIDVESGDIFVDERNDDDVAPSDDVAASTGIELNASMASSKKESVAEDIFVDERNDDANVAAVVQKGSKIRSVFVMAKLKNKLANASIASSRKESVSGGIFVDERHDDADDAAVIEKEGKIRSVFVMAKIKNKLAKIKKQPSQRELSISMGKHLTTANVFTMEQMSNRSVQIIMAVYYISFVVLFATSFIYFNPNNTKLPFAIMQNNEICSPEHDSNGTLSCVSNSIVTVDQAKLLANTVVVSDGLDLTNWVGKEAENGTADFQATNISQAAFLVHSSILVEECNPELNYSSSELNYTWSDIEGVFWMGDNEVRSEGSKSVIIDLVFERPDKTPWPSNVTNEPFPLAFNAYACVRGGPNDCQSVGHFRDQFIQDKDDPHGYLDPVRTVDGPKFTVSVHIPNALLLEDVVESIGWRIVAFADPGGAVTGCIVGNNCIVYAHVSGETTTTEFTSAVEVAILVIYAIYFTWWIYTVASRLGMKLNTWHVEDQWVLILGVGFLMYNGFYYVSLQLYLLTNNFEFKERMWAACLVLKQLGQVLVYFALACFCDAPRRFVVSKFDFYKWKAFFLLCFYTSMFVVTMYNFPAASGRDKPGTELAIGGLGFVTSSSTWPRNDKIVLVTFEIVWILCIVFGLAYYVWRSYKTKKALANLPYNMTRPVQLSFKFFCWATSLWVILEVVSLCVSIRDVAQWSHRFRSELGFLNNAVLFLNQLKLFSNSNSITKLISSFMFTVVYEMFFLPLPTISKDAISKSHHVTEEDAKVKANEERVTGRFLLVLDRARLLCCCSREVYLPFDDEERKSFTGITQEELESIRLSSKHISETISESSVSVSCDQSVSGRKEDPAMVTTPGSKRQLKDSFLHSTISLPTNEKLDPVILARCAGEAVCTGRKSPPGSSWGMGCRVIKRITEPDYADMHNTRAILYRHEPSNDLIITFRGTATGVQIKTDCMTQKVRISLDTFLTIPRSKRNIVENIIPEKIEEMLCEGNSGNVRLFDLLHKETEVGDLPEFLRDRTNAQDGINGSAFLHFGFWSSYSRLRKQVHSAIYEELVSNPGRLLVCGHSLGGAQATACAYDMSRWIIPSVRKNLLLNQGRGAAEKISLSCYTYGSPRLGGRKFRAAFNKAVPDMQRIVCDGDVVTIAIPKWLGFRHVGDENVFDYTGACGRNPSFMEKTFAHKSRTSGDSHRMTSYTHAIKMAYHPSVSIKKLLELLKNVYGSDSPDVKDFWTSTVSQSK